jgi:hypothetical protein
MKHTCSNCAAEGRAVGSLVRHLAMKSLKSGEKSAGEGSVGGGRVGIMKMAWLERIIRSH